MPLSTPALFVQLHNSGLFRGKYSLWGFVSIVSFFKGYSKDGGTFVIKADVTSVFKSANSTSKCGWNNDSKGTNRTSTGWRTRAGWSSSTVHPHSSILRESALYQYLFVITADSLSGIQEHRETIHPPATQTSLKQRHVFSGRIFLLAI